MDTAAPGKRKLIDLDAVKELTGDKDRTWYYKQVRKGRFPAPIQLGANSIAWYEDEVLAWLAARPRVTYGPCAA